MIGPYKRVKVVRFVQVSANGPGWPRAKGLTNLARDNIERIDDNEGAPCRTFCVPSLTRIHPCCRRLQVRRLQDLLTIRILSTWTRSCHARERKCHHLALALLR